MKIYLVGHERAKEVGGGFRFCDSFLKGGFDFVEDWKDSDIYFITSCTLVDRDKIKKVKQAGKKIVFRVDNLPKQSNNRGTAFGNLRLCASLADLVIYQSEWAKDYVGWFLRDLKFKDKIIYNGADDEIFHDVERVKNIHPIFLYVMRRGEDNKCWGQAAYMFHRAHRVDPAVALVIAGSADSKLREYGFDFVSGEDYSYIGQIQTATDMAMCYRNIDILLAPYFNDACSQTIIEARLCGCTIWTGTNGETGGTPEIMKLPLEQLKLGYMLNNYRSALDEVFKG